VRACMHALHCPNAETGRRQKQKVMSVNVLVKTYGPSIYFNEIGMYVRREIGWHGRIDLSLQAKAE
jgi:hypothetical protein